MIYMNGNLYHTIWCVVHLFLCISFKCGDSFTLHVEERWVGGKHARVCVRERDAMYITAFARWGVCGRTHVSLTFTHSMCRSYACLIYGVCVFSKKHSI